MKTPFYHPHAIIEEGVSIGAGTRVWAFAHIVTGAVLGIECNICDHTFIEGKVRLGNRVTLKCGVCLWDGLIAEDDVFIGPNAVFTNDRFPRSRHPPVRYLNTLLRTGCSLGANCTVLSDLIIGEWAMVGAGAVVTRAVPDYALVMGNPARIRGWICRCGSKLSRVSAERFHCPCGKVYEEVAKNKIQEKQPDDQSPIQSN